MKESSFRIPDLLHAPWAILPSKLEEIHAVYQAHLEGQARDLAPYQPNHADVEEKPYEITGGVAIIPVHGTIARRMNLMTYFSGGTSTELLLKVFQLAIADPFVDAIVLDMDSPGGAVGGITNIADAIYGARGQKPIIAFAGDMMASAAYWIGSAADMVIAESTSIVGSIGVVTVHTDYSGRDAKAGITRTYITAGKYKAISNDAQPLSEEGRQEIRSMLDTYYTLFVDTVARNRGTSTENVLANMADGRVFIGAQAVENGLIDEIGTIDDAVLAAMSRVSALKPTYLIRR